MGVIASTVVHCRIGSLETNALTQDWIAKRSLPHRQLRKSDVPLNTHFIRSLPHRQLRKIVWPKTHAKHCSLPHRQLRKVKDPRTIAVAGSLPHRQLRNYEALPDDVRAEFTAA